MRRRSAARSLATTRHAALLGVLLGVAPAATCAHAQDRASGDHATMDANRDGAGDPHDRDPRRAEANGAAPDDDGTGHDRSTGDDANGARDAPDGDGHHDDGDENASDGHASGGDDDATSRDGDGGGGDEDPSGDEDDPAPVDDASSGLPSALFFGGVVLSIVVAGMGGYFGVTAIFLRDGEARRDPRFPRDTGPIFEAALAADVLIGTGLALGIATAVLGFFTDFGSSSEGADDDEAGDDQSGGEEESRSVDAPTARVVPWVSPIQAGLVVEVSL